MTKSICDYGDLCSILAKAPDCCKSVTTSITVNCGFGEYRNEIDLATVINEITCRDYITGLWFVEFICIILILCLVSYRWCSSKFPRTLQGDLVWNLIKNKTLAEYCLKICLFNLKILRVLNHDYQHLEVGLNLITLLLENLITK